MFGTYAEFNGSREEVKLLADLLLQRLTSSRFGGEMNERGHDDAGFALQGLDNGVGKLSTSVCHREGSRSSAILGLDDFITAILDTVGKLLEGALVDA